MMIRLATLTVLTMELNCFDFINSRSLSTLYAHGNCIEIEFFYHSLRKGYTQIGVAGSRMMLVICMPE